MAKEEVSIEEIDGEKVVVKRSGKKLEGLSAKCTHNNCTVAYNKKDKTLDCPCHGSRFDLAGKVKEGPADTPLPKVNLKEEDGTISIN